MVNNAIDITDQKFGKLTAKNKTGESKQGNLLWLCICECGNKIKVKSNNLKSGNTKSCGCLRFRHEDLAGNVYGRLTAIKHTKKIRGNYYWLCKCECGNKKEVRISHLKNGSVKSCSCFRDEVNLDILGKKFGKLTAVKPAKRGWLCECECGKLKRVSRNNLISGKAKSCGCFRKEKATYELVGKKFGKLTARKSLKKWTIYNSRIWLCECDCGNMIEVSRQLLTNKKGWLISCGCARRKLGLPDEAYKMPGSTKYSKFLTDSYVRCLIVSTIKYHSSGKVQISKEDVLQETIDIKRAQLGFYRELKKAKELLKNV